MSRCATLLCAILLTMPISALGGSCPFEKSVYEDVDGNGFRLEFGPSQVDAVRIVHSATITHPKRGTVFELDFAYAMGYAQHFLSTRDGGKDDTVHNVHFFDKHLRSTDPDEFAAPYAFIEGLGRTDWYGGEIEIARKIPIGDPLWRFASCRESSSARGSDAAKETTESPEKLSSAEWVTDDGRIAAYGEIKDVGKKEGYRFLSIDYGEWISEEKCSRRVGAGTLDMEESDCEIDSLRYDNQNPKLREFAVADNVEVVILHPSRPIKMMTWDQFAEMWHAWTDDTRELWDGLWQISRRDDTVERIEWVYTP